MNETNNAPSLALNKDSRPQALHIALLSAYAVGLHSIEALIPSPIPWLRLGLANIITLTTLYLYGIKAGMTVTLTRVFIRSLLAGTFLGPAFVMSLGAGVVSTLFMGGIIRLFGRFSGPVSVSIIGALAHNITQLFLAYFLFVRRVEAILIISPVILAFGTLTGVFNGIATGLILKKIRQSKEEK